MRIVFMGTPDFAVPSLDILVSNGYTIVGVITAPDRPAGRGRQLTASPVKQYALSKGLTVIQPTNLKNEAFISELKALKADLQIVVAFRMLPEVVWDMPTIGTFNLHASLLPNYRGAAPINWAIINGESETGLSTFFISHKIDTGAILFQQKIAIDPSDTAGTLHDKLMLNGARLVLDTVKSIETDNYSVSEQDLTGDYPKAPKIFRENCEINWNNNSQSIYNFIRGLSPYPAAWTTLDGKTFKLFFAEILAEKHNKAPGTVLTDETNYLKIASTDGWLNLIEVQIEGKRKMDVKAFMLGYKGNYIIN